MKTLSRSRSPEYIAWGAMIRRCMDQKHEKFSYYGGRGIKVCDKWLKSFESFLADMGQRPSPLHTLDRFPNSDGHYEPGNVRWATKKEQARNRRSNRVLEFRGEKKSVAEWAEIVGIPAAAIRLRINKLGYSVEKALTMPLRTWPNGHPRRVAKDNHCKPRS